MRNDATNTTTTTATTINKYQTFKISKTLKWRKKRDKKYVNQEIVHAFSFWTRKIQDMCAISMYAYLYINSKFLQLLNS